MSVCCKVFVKVKNCHYYYYETELSVHIYETQKLASYMEKTSGLLCHFIMLRHNKVIYIPVVQTHCFSRTSVWFFTTISFKSLIIGNIS